MAGVDVARGLEAFIRLAHQDLDLATLVDEADRALAALVAFDSSCWLTFDPATLLPTSHITRDEVGPEILLLLARNEYCEDDVNKFTLLARSTPPVGILSAATGGRLERSPRYRELLAPHGFGDELRAAFVSNGVMWGGVTLHRVDCRFGDADTAAIAAVGPHVADAIRRAIVTATAATGRPDGPGLVIVDDDSVVVAMSGAARRWLGEIVGPQNEEDELPLVVHGIIERTRAAGTGAAEVRVPTRSGGWLMLHGSTLDGERAGQVALILEPARAPQIAPLIADAYGLSHREREVTTLVIQGLSTAEIAQALHLSPYTVQDHLKTIFAKFGLRSRRELVAHIFFRHYAPEIERRSTPAADGWFVDPAR
jgi:DNA-binding CsgD family transcriptional regulator